MSPAELKAWRERLGLSTRFLAERWQVRELTVQRWERNRVAPPEILVDMHRLIDQFHAIAADLAASDLPVIAVPRTDVTSPDDWPATWHRAVALEARMPMIFTDEPTPS